MNEKISAVQLMATDQNHGFAIEVGPALVDALKEHTTRVAETQIKESTQGVFPHDEPAIPLSNAAFLDFRSSFAAFVETKFIPEHVQYKTRAGQIHYEAMLKHIITPERVTRFFHAERDVPARMRGARGWPYLDAIRLCDLRPEHIRRIIAAACGAGYSAQTVKHIKNVCFAVIAHAQREGCFIGPNPACLVKLPKLAQSTFPALSTCQAKQILELLHYPHRVAALFALTTNMSLPEICDLRWRHINLEQSERVSEGHHLPCHTLLVNTWWNRAGLGDTRGRSKSKIVTIREPLLSTLRELRRTRPVSDPNEDLILLSDTGEKMTPVGFWGIELKRVAKDLGLSRLTWQDLRRSCQALSTELRSEIHSSSSWSPVDSCTNYPGEETSTRHKVQGEQFRSEPNIQRRLCFGRRLRVSSAHGVQPYSQNRF